MSLGNTLERLGKHIVLAPRIFARYGCLRPRRVRLTNCQNWVHIDPTDGRAVKKFILDPIRGRVSPPLAFWRAFNAHLEPSVSIDVGVNYGECLFGTCYPSATRVFGFEANPRLIPYLEKSLAGHPDAQRITLTHGLVSDHAAQNIPFYVDPAWSGGASAIRALNDGPGTLSFHIASRTLDSVIPRVLCEGRRILFKMDIEGYEPRAFRGFWDSLAVAELAVGFVEFDSCYITAAGDSPEEYFQRLQERFDVYRTHDRRGQTILPVRQYSSLPLSRATDGRVHTDLILATRGTPPAHWLPSTYAVG